MSDSNYQKPDNFQNTSFDPSRFDSNGTFTPADPSQGTFTPADPSQGTFTPADPSINPSTVDPSINDGILQSSGVQEGAGVLYGTVQAITPGGFIADPNLINKINPDVHPSRDFEVGRGVALLANGIAEVIGGVTVEGGGLALDSTGGGAVLGITLNVAGAGLMAQGGINICDGAMTLLNSMSISSNSNGNDGNDGNDGSTDPTSTTSSPNLQDTLPVVDETPSTSNENIPSNHETTISNPVLDESRVGDGTVKGAGSGNKVDLEYPIYNNEGNIVKEFPATSKGHGWPDIIDNYAGDATVTELRPGVTLYQLSGDYNGMPGRFEWIIDKNMGGVTHRQFVPNGTINGIPSKP